MLSPITFKNYAGQCDHQHVALLERAKREGGLAAQVANEALSYMDVQKRPYVHLVDGALADNMALRGILEAVGLVGGYEQLLKLSRVKKIHKLVILAVNAETTPDAVDYRSDQVPVMSQAMKSMIDAPINRYSFDTVMLMRLALKEWQKELLNKPQDHESPFASDAKIYFINASLGEVANPDERFSLMKIPTTLYLTDNEIDRLVRTASDLVLRDSEFQRLMGDIQGK